MVCNNFPAPDPGCGARIQSTYGAPLYEIEIFFICGQMFLKACLYSRNDVTKLLRCICGPIFSAMDAVTMETRC